MSNLIMLQAISATVTRGTRKDCWNTFNVVERKIEAADATKLIVYRRQVTAMYVNDHNGRQAEGRRRPAAVLAGVREDRRVVQRLGR